MTRYLYRRNETLYFVLEHPGFVMEINYNKSLIKELLTLLAQRYETCARIKISTIKAYAKPLPPRPRPKRWRIAYKERARGDFPCEGEFAPILEKIKKAIRNNADA